MDAEALARHAVARDPEAWRTVFETHYRTVFSFVRYRLRGAAEAEDIASRVFEVAYTRADRFDYRGVPIEGWLIGIARNVVRDYIKKVARRGPEAEWDDTMSPSLADTASAVDLHHDLALAMRELTEDQQAVLHQRFILDRSVAETALALDRSEDAVKNLQRRALAAMARALAPTGYSGQGR